jgi:hypothetical protein
MLDHARRRGFPGWWHEHIYWLVREQSTWALQPAEMRAEPLDAWQVTMSHACCSESASQIERMPPVCSGGCPVEYLHIPGHMK